MGIRMLVSGDRACFKRPEFAHDLISYDVITPSAARGLLDAIHRDPGLRWVIDEIRVLRPIRFTWMALAEVETGDPAGPLPVRIAGPADRRIASVLSDVEYLLTAHAEPVGGAEDVEALFWRAVATGRVFRPLFLGFRGFPAEIEPLEEDELSPPGAYDGSGAIDLGWTLFDAKREARGGMQFYRPTMVDGVIDLRHRDALILAG